MRILAIDQYGELGGAQRCLQEAIGAFVRRGWQVHLAAPAGPLAEKLEPDCASRTKLPCGPLTARRKTAQDVLRFVRQWPHQISTLRALAADHRVDVLYVNGPRVLPAAVIAAQGKPVVFHAHSVIPQSCARWLARGAALARNVSVIASSRWVANSLPDRALRIIYNGVAPTARSLSGRRYIKTVAVVGRISPEKGQLDFVRAAQLLADDLPEVEFTIRGAPMFESDNYAARVREAACAAHVSLNGWSEDTASLYEDIDLLVVPSQSVENTPRVILEAFSAGVPVIAFAAGGIPELIRHGETGTLVHDRTPKALAAAILKAALWPGQVAQLAEQALAVAQSRFSLDRFQAEVCDALIDAARRHQRMPLHIAGATVRQ